MFQNLICKAIDALQDNNRRMKSCTVGKFNRIVEQQDGKMTKLYFAIYGDRRGVSIGRVVSYNMVQCKKTEIIYVQKVVQIPRMFDSVSICDRVVTNHAFKFVGYTIEAVVEKLYYQGLYEISHVAPSYCGDLKTLRQNSGNMHIMQYEKGLCVAMCEA